MSRRSLTTTGTDDEQDFQPRAPSARRAPLEPSEGDWTRREASESEMTQFSIRASKSVYERFKKLTGKDPVTKAKRSNGDALEMLLDYWESGQGRG